MENKIFNIDEERKNKLVECVVPEGTEMLGKECFKDCLNLQKVKLPKSLKTIGYGAFTNCEKLEEIIMPKNVTNINSYAFCDCNNLKKLVFSPNIKNLDFDIIKNCNNLEDVELPENLEVCNFTLPNTKLKQFTIPKNIERLNSFFFAGCKDLKKINFNKNLEYIPYGMFTECTSLKEVNLPLSISEIRRMAFKGCSVLETVNMEDEVSVLGDEAFNDCVSLKKVKLSKNIKNIPNSAFNNCRNLSEINLKNVKSIDECSFEFCYALKELDLQNVEKIGKEAFFCCKGLEKVVLNNNIELGEHIFKNTEFNYFYTDLSTNLSYFVKELPKGLDTTKNQIINLTEAKKYIIDLDMGYLLKENYKNEVIKLVKSKITMPSEILNSYLADSQSYEHYKTLNFKHFSNTVENLDKIIKSNTVREVASIYNFANALGCFADTKMIDKNGKETSAIVAQKASTLLNKILKDETFYCQFEQYFSNVPLTGTPQLSLLNFLTNTNDLSNIKLLKELCDIYPNLKNEVINKFDSVVSLRTVLDEDGKPKNLSWKDAIVKFAETKIYDNINEENKDIAKLFSQKGLKEESFNMASDYRQRAKEKKMKPHILSKPLKETSILETIDKVKNETGNVLKEAGLTLSDLYQENFTYEMLDKYDPANAIMGVYASCCATIDSSAYGFDITKAVLMENDVQNLVVKDKQGNIVAKGTLYVNRDAGYGVFNDFEINSKYKKHEYDKGYYEVPEDSRDELLREEIFSTLKRGMMAFIKEYDKENSDKPIKEVVVGMGYNRLKRQCDRYMIKTQKYSVPDKFSFVDADREQRLLYSRGVPEKELMI